VVIDYAHIGVTISPGPYATSTDLTEAVATILLAYSALLAADPNYTGYLRVGIAQIGPTNKYLVTQVFEATAYETRAYTIETGLRIEYINYVFENRKSVSYTYYIQGYQLQWS
jgi:hypothetical protein